MAIQAFISYKNEQRPHALKLRDALQAWGYNTWLDQDNIRSGMYFRDEIQAGLEASAVVVGILTQAALKSREVLAEWDYAFSGKARLLLLRYEPVELPYWLSTVQYIDCFHDEHAALSRLAAELQEADSSHYQPAPAYIQRPQSKKTFKEYQTSGNERKPDNRTGMLEKVYQAWILGALKPNLQAGTLDIGLGLKADAVLRHADYGDYQLPDSNRNIAQIFEDMHGELLILGEAGSGKTILMLQLLEHLLGIAQNDVNAAIPVVLNLSSWGQEKAPLETWLINEMKRAYGLDIRQSKEWLRQENLIFLLDGLDEIIPNRNFGYENLWLAATKEGIRSENERYRDPRHEEVALKTRLEAVEEINRFRDTHKKLDMVICSRIRDYDALQEKLNLNGAILLQDLKEGQIQRYLQGEEFAGIRDLLAKEDSARILAKAPFLLATMKSSYQGILYEGSPHKRLKLEDTRLGARRNHLFEEYLDRQSKLYPSTKYPREQVLHYLRWLAYQMDIHRTTVFYIEDIQRDWIKNDNWYHLILILLFGSIFLLLTIPVVLLFGVIGLLVGSLIILGVSLFGFISGLINPLGILIDRVIIRFILVYEGNIPDWEYAGFLDYVTQAGILRKIGSAYIFRHRMLLEYFERQYRKQNESL
jgi:hypothetical protein